MSTSIKKLILPKKYETWLLNNVKYVLVTGSNDFNVDINKHLHLTVADVNLKGGYVDVIAFELQEVERLSIDAWRKLKKNDLIKLICKPKQVKKEGRKILDELYKTKIK
tara:strand:+ start:45432 stop:45758 length:327 start_codon:yes stop_codon:yes gene_type:complete